MEILLIGLGAGILFLVNAFRTETRKNLKVINKRVINLHKEVKEILDADKIVSSEKKQELNPIQKPAAEVINTQKAKEDVKAQVQKPIAEQKKEEPLKREEPKEVIQPKPVQTIQEKKPQIIAKSKPVEEKKESAAEINRRKAAMTTKKPVTPKDYEKVIGENWLSKIGIAILVIGIGFFVKFAIDKNWIGEVGRVAIGMGCGTLLIGIAHFLKTKYRAFSSVLIGGGLSVFYYTISIGYHEYGIFSQPVAFGIMVGITSLAVLLSVIYDRKELAIIALIGGFTTPFMVQGEANNFIAFFTYIAILNMGMMLLSYFKKWHLLHRLSLGFTLLFFGSWMLLEDVTAGAKFKAAILFSCIYFVQFLGMNMIYNLRHKVKFNAWEFIQLLTTIVLYYGAMMYLLSNTPEGDFRGALTLTMAALMGILGYIIYRVEAADKNLGKFLIAKVITFVTLFVMVQFKGNYLALFWSVEALVLLFIAQRSKMQLLKDASFLITVASIVGLVRLWLLNYMFSYSVEPIMFNEAFMSGAFAIGTYLGTYFLLNRESEKATIFGFEVAQYRSFLTSGIFIIAYFVCLLELMQQAGRFENAALEQLVTWIFHFILLIVGQVLAFKSESEFKKQLMFGLGILISIAFLVIGFRNNIEIRNAMMAGNIGQLAFLAHLIPAALIITTLVLSKKLSRGMIDEKMQAGLTIFMSLIGIILCSHELEMIATHMFAGNAGGTNAVLTHVRGAGYTVLWGLYSFGMMIYGMRTKQRQLRIFALLVLTLTLIKLFAIDIQGISEAGKIIAFISLGILLLIISFLYQKLKQLIVDGGIDKVE